MAQAGEAGAPGNIRTGRISPDGRTVVVERAEALETHLEEVASTTREFLRKALGEGA
jgi:hypothetical protein